MNLTKGSYEIIYKNVVLRSDSTQMDLNCFFEAIEEIAIRLFGNKDPYDNLMQIISMANSYVDLGLSDTSTVVSSSHPQQRLQDRLPSIVKIDQPNHVPLRNNMQQPIQ